MRLPRVRLTVGTLLIAVAVVAANCWAFRRFYETNLYTGGRISYRLLPAGVGVLPLFNLALIGVLLFATGRLRSLGRGHPATPRSSLPVVAYFGLQFLVLGGLVCLFMPDEIPVIQAILDAVTGYAAESWGSVFGEPKGSIPWVICDSALLGVIISGPPLVLSWIGRALARRAAATLPRRRFRALTVLVSTGFASAGLAVCLTPRPFEGEQEVALDFEVHDQVSGRPVAAALVCLTDPFSPDPESPPPRALTDAAGRARLTGRFIARGECNAFQTLGVFTPWGRWLEVTAAGHRARRVPLTEILGQFPDPARPGLGRVALVRGGTREKPFRDIAGVYSTPNNGFGGSWFEIDPDGRFAWCEWGCVPPDLQEYGYVKRLGGEIQFVPIPHPGRDVDPLLSVNYRVVEWGDRHYLSASGDDDLRDFCRQALTPKRPSRSRDRTESYLLRSDAARPQTGLPRLPARVWVAFLGDEMNLRNPDGSLRLALDTLTARLLRPARRR